MRIRQSKLKTWMSCPYKYDLIYNRNIVRRVDSPAISTGTMIHLGFEMALKKESIDAGIGAIVENSAAEEADELVSIFVRSYKNLGIEKGRWKTMVDGESCPMVEYQIEGKIDGHVVNGIIDWVAIDTETGLPWLIDFKTRKVSQSVAFDEFQYQLPLYQYILNSQYGLKHKIYGTAIYEIKAKKESEPYLTKSGKLPKRLGAMNPNTLESFCEKNGIPHDEYISALINLRPIDEMYRHYRSESEIDAIVSDFVIASTMLEEASFFPRNLNQLGCQFCGYKTFCQAELKNYDTEELLETTYERVKNVS